MLELKILSKSINNSYLFTIFTNKLLNFLFYFWSTKYNILIFYGLKNYISTKNTFIDILLFGFIKGYNIYLELHGTGYKFKLINTKTFFGIILRVGYSHIIYSKLTQNFRVSFFSKVMLCFYTTNLWVLNNKLQSIKLHKKPNIYKKKGLFWKNSIINLKKSKKLKF